MKISLLLKIHDIFNNRHLYCTVKYINIALLHNIFFGILKCSYVDGNVCSKFQHCYKKYYRIRNFCLD